MYKKKLINKKLFLNKKKKKKKKKSINNINSTCNIFSYGWVDNLLSTPHMVEYNKLYYELDVSFRLIKKRKNNVQRITRKNNKRNTKLLL